jgi:hypothetical protein
MIQTLRDMICRAPVIQVQKLMKWNKKRQDQFSWEMNRSHYTSMGVDSFFSLILSYFCFLVPAFSPCQGRLKIKSTAKGGGKNNMIKIFKSRRVKIHVYNKYPTFLLRSTWEHNQAIPDHPFCFVLPIK